LFFRAQSSATQGTLQQAITDKHYIEVSLKTGSEEVDLRGAQLTIVFERPEYHADRALAIATSATGLAAGDVVGQRTGLTNDGASAVLITLSENAALRVPASTDLQLRIIPFNGQYGHKTGISSFKIVST
jgi:malonyl CoA-acyl carrier protein transacylase